ncbi:MAG: hypothetical protein ISR48_07545 [Alphaproteobacteria bacterium]|nr:hypothetical protein [Alphaproteobacteria bacterium]
MAREIRKIIFDQQDLLESMINYAQRVDYVLPRARITGFDIHEDSEAGISLRFKFDDPSVTTNISFNQDQIGAALIMHCKNKRILLPRNANKSLVTHEEGLALQVAIDWNKFGENKK